MYPFPPGEASATFRRVFLRVSLVWRRSCSPRRATAGHARGRQRGRLIVVNIVTGIPFTEGHHGVFNPVRRARLPAEPGVGALFALIWKDRCQDGVHPESKGDSLKRVTGHKGRGGGDDDQLICRIAGEGRAE